MRPSASRSMTTDDRSLAFRLLLVASTRLDTRINFNLCRVNIVTALLLFAYGEK